MNSLSIAKPQGVGGDVWKEFVANFEKWLTYTCYLMLGWVFIDILPLLPVHIAERLIDFVLDKLGI